MHVRLYLLLGKKLFAYAFYLTGTVLFILFSYKTANKFDQVSLIPQPPLSSSSINFQLRRLPNYYEDLNKCQNSTSNSSSRLFSKIIRATSIINYLGFVLRSHSLFYCSVPKVATRTLLPFITFLHIRDDILPLLTNQSKLTVLQADRDLHYNNKAHLFYLEHLKQMIFSANQTASDTSTSNSVSILESFLSRLMLPKGSNLSKVDLWILFQKNALPFMRLKTMSNPSMIFSPNFTRVIFVRHPLERLASAYVDKIASLKYEPFSMYDSLRRTICRKYASHYLTMEQQAFYLKRRKLGTRKTEPCHNIIPKFEDFIRYIVSDSLQDDVHWQSYSKLCNVCLLKYNYIVKYENMAEELEQFVTFLGLNPADWNIDNYFKTGKTQENYQSMYMNMSTSLMCSLKYFYEEDFKLFDYRLEDYLQGQKTLHCSPPSTHVKRKT